MWLIWQTVIGKIPRQIPFEVTCLRCYKCGLSIGCECSGAIKIFPARPLDKRAVNDDPYFDMSALQAMGLGPMDTDEDRGGGSLLKRKETEKERERIASTAADEDDLQDDDIFEEEVAAGRGKSA